MDGVGKAAPHAKDRAKQVRARAKVSNLPQEFQRVTLLLKRIRGIGIADHSERSRNQLPFLALSLGWDKAANNLDGRSGCCTGNLVVSRK